LNESTLIPRTFTVSHQGDRNLAVRCVHADQVSE
jgi:hypothetical protein